MQQSSPNTARVNGHAAAPDRHVQVDCMVVDQVQGRAATGAVHREVHLADGTAVAHWAVGNQAGRAAHHQAGGEDLPAGRHTRFTAAVDHQHMAGRHAFDAFALRVVGVVEGADLVQVFPRRDVAHGEGGADQVATRWVGQACDALDEDVAETALEQLRAKRGDADMAQQPQCVL